MQIKMIITDIDDTLVDDDLQVSERTIEVVRMAQEMGVYFVLASGRPTEAIYDVAAKMQLDRNKSFIVSYNGAVIIDLKDDSVIYENKLPMETALSLLKISREEGVFFHTYQDGVILTEQDNEYTDIEGDITGLRIKTVNSIPTHLKGDVVKVLMLEEPDKLKAAEKRIKERLGDSLSVYISKPYFLEFMNRGIDKGAALNRLTEYVGIGRENVMAVGDSYNDLAMIVNAGIGVAVSNAKPDVIRIADYVTLCNNTDGVADVIEKFVLSKDITLFV